MKFSEIELYVRQFEDWNNTYGPYEIIDSLDEAENPLLVWTNISRLSANYLVNEIRDLNNQYDEESYFLCKKPYIAIEELSIITDLNLPCGSCSDESNFDCEFCFGETSIWLDITEGKTLLDSIASWDKKMYLNFFKDTQ